MPDRDRIRRALSLRGRSSADLRVVNKAADLAEVYLYSEIGFWGTTAADFAQEIGALDVGQIVLHINSPGGEAWDGQAMYHVLKDHRASVEVRVEGIAASAASTVAMAGDRIVMAPHSMMMIHDPWGVTIGDARDHQKSAELLDKLGDAIAGFYADRAGGRVREWRDRMLEETWYSDRETVDAGLADEVAGDEAPENRFDLSLFSRTPEHLLRAAPKDGREVTKREAEQALRDAGLPAAAAKAVLAGGWDGLSVAARDERELVGLAAFIRSVTP